MTLPFIEPGDAVDAVNSNKTIRAILEASGLDPDGNFPGFATLPLPPTGIDINGNQINNIEVIGGNVVVDGDTITITIPELNNLIWVIDTGVPDDGDGNDGDLYVDQSTGDLYQKISGSWVYIMNLKGIQGEKGDKGDKGDTGDTGPKGDTGETGATGSTGSQGPQGDPGVGVPAGGTTGQVLKKKTDTDYDTEWGDGGGNNPITLTIPLEDVPIDPMEEEYIDFELPAHTIHIYMRDFASNPAYVPYTYRMFKTASDRETDSNYIEPSYSPVIISDLTNFVDKFYIRLKVDPSLIAPQGYLSAFSNAGSVGPPPNPLALDNQNAIDSVTLSGTWDAPDSSYECQDLYAMFNSSGASNGYSPALTGDAATAAIFYDDIAPTAEDISLWFGAAGANSTGSTSLILSATGDPAESSISIKISATPDSGSGTTFSCEIGYTDSVGSYTSWASDSYTLSGTYLGMWDTKLVWWYFTFHRDAIDEYSVSAYLYPYGPDGSSVLDVDAFNKTTETLDHKYIGFHLVDNLAVVASEPYPRRVNNQNPFIFAYGTGYTYPLFIINDPAAWLDDISFDFNYTYLPLYSNPSP